MTWSKLLVEKLQVTHGSSSSLAHLYWQLSKAERLRCQLSWVGASDPCSLPHMATAMTLEQALFVNLCSDKHNMIWSIASDVKKVCLGEGRRISTISSACFQNGPIDFRKPSGNTGSATEVITPQIYLLLLLLIVKARIKSQVPLAFQLFRELNTLLPLAAEFRLASTLLFSAMEFCEDFPLLLDLRLMFDNYMNQDSAKSADFANHYAGAALHILLNSGQYVLAVKYLEETLLLVESLSLQQMYSALPMGKFWASACSVRDFRILADLLEAYLQCEDVPPILAGDLMQYLGVGLACNDHKLVRVAYGALMDLGVALSLSVLAQIVHVFSTRGDVDLCIKIIEEQYLHLKGESALTKELTLSIILAYCHRSSDPAGVEDSSWHSVMDVIESFSRKWPFSYHEICDAVLYKLNRLSIEDDKVKWAKRRDSFRIDQHLASRETQLESLDADEPQTSTILLPKKATNPNIHLGKQGNVLRNMEALLSFTIHSVEHMQQNGFELHARQLIVNCILSHINLYQNFSGAVHFLAALQRAEPGLAGSLLNLDLYEILFESISRSPASVKCGIFMFQNLMRRGHAFTQHQMECLMISSLRHLQYNLLLELYSHESLARGFSPSEYVIERILLHKQLNDAARMLATTLRTCEPGNKVWIAQQWAQNKFQSSMEGMQLPELQAPYSEIDERDCKLLRKVFEHTGIAPGNELKTAGQMHFDKISGSLHLTAID